MVGEDSEAATLMDGWMDDKWTEKHFSWYFCFISMY
jgi:hypothetical protein